jgi:hypothetical protein
VDSGLSSSVLTVGPHACCPQVYGHRMACWEEHLGTIEDAFQTPQDVNCVRRVRKLAAVRPITLKHVFRDVASELA